MSILALLLLAVGLSMDAFAVSVCKGLAIKQINFKKALVVGLYFGVFQAGMPLIGYLLGTSFQDKIQTIDHWIAFVLLAIIGINMIRGALKKDEEEEDGSLDFKSMLILAVATSIDALAVGVTFAFLKVNVWLAITLIGVTTCTLSMVGVKIGHVFGAKYKARAEFAGGVILLFLGLKILLEHLELLG